MYLAKTIKYLFSKNSKSNHCITANGVYTLLRGTLFECQKYILYSIHIQQRLYQISNNAVLLNLVSSNVYVTIICNNFPV